MKDILVIDDFMLIVVFHIRDGPSFFYRGVYLFRKKIVRKL